MDINSTILCELTSDKNILSKVNKCIYCQTLNGGNQITRGRYQSILSR